MESDREYSRYYLASSRQRNMLGLVCVVVSYRALIASHRWVSSFKIIAAKQWWAFLVEFGGLSYFSFPARWHQCTKALCSQLELKGLRGLWAHSLKSLSILARASSLWIHFPPILRLLSVGVLCARGMRGLVDEHLWHLTVLGLKEGWDFPSGLAVKTPCFQSRRCGFDPWSGNLKIPHATLPPSKKSEWFLLLRISLC